MRSSTKLLSLILLPVITLAADRPWQALTGAGPAQVWDANAGTIGPADSAAAGNGTVRLHLELEPFGTRFIVISAVPPGAAAK